MRLFIYSCVSKLSDSSSMRATAMLEQWSEIRSRFVSRSLNTKPWLSVHMPFLQAVDVVQLHLVAEVIYKLLKRLDAVSAFQIVCDKRIYRGVCDLGHGGYEDVHLARTVLGKDDALFVYLLRAFCNVQRMVGDTFKVIYRVQIFADGLVLLGVKLAACYMYEICSELILVFIDDILGIGDVGKAVIGVVVNKRKCVEQIFTRLFGHGVYRQAALLNGEGGWSRKRSSSLSKSSRTAASSGLSLMMSLQIFSSSGINGASIATMTKRNTVFIRARLTVVMVIDMKEKSNMAFRV